MVFYFDGKSSKLFNLYHPFSNILSNDFIIRSKLIKFASLKSQTAKLFKRIQLDYYE